MMQGKVVGDTFVVLDSFALPVEGAHARPVRVLLG